MAPGRRGHRHDALPAGRRRRRATASALVSLYVSWDGQTGRECELTGLRRVLRPAALGARSCPTPRSRRSATSSRSTSRCSSRAPTSSRSTCRAGSPAPCALGRAGARAARRARRRRRAHRGARLGHRLRRPRADGGRRRQRRRPRGDVAEAADAAQALRRGSRSLLRRHARVPAPRRAHRRRQRLARHGAEDQADPHDRARDHADRARAHLAAAPSSAWSSTCSAARARRRPLLHPAHPGRGRRPPSSPRAGARSTAATPSSCRRSAPSSAPTPAPG